ncbi:hypothetical protein FIBSPDRAFT_1055953 [Athelia psychrophila]|uniref:Carbohydrate-binding module family 18 protein n=1 Tax=Athelia psychrophila TaxID=1759441 RepID=A0A167SWE4_9AGAM|nr:hypothetical protein FIBSPDRAFT_1055953 [Fibularhizoctonia sp. CBS 109695]
MHFTKTFAAVALAVAAQSVAQTFTLACDSSIQVPSGCYTYGYCQSAGFYESCAAGTPDCASGFATCSAHCQCNMN